MPTYELINPSDQYTFVAPSLDVAGVAVALLSTSFGARDLATDESTPVLFGWDEWLDGRGIDNEWLGGHAAEVAAALESFLLGSAADRKTLEDARSAMSAGDWMKWVAARHDRQRSSVRDIGAAATRLAANLRKKYGVNPNGGSNVETQQAGGPPAGDGFVGPDEPGGPACGTAPGANAGSGA